jgi:UDP-2,4-diacetamido-2,4,6-trideoxy-beta-L-altropyranose hydrolase
MRSIALAQAWRGLGGTVEFLSRQLSQSLLERLRREGFVASTLQAESGTNDDLRETIARAKVEAAVVVVDGYHLGPAMAQGLAQAGLTTLLIDDDGSDEHLSCHVLNQNLHASTELYPRAQQELLLGPGYALLRDELVSRVWPTAEEPELASRLVVSFGGSDPAGMSGLAARCGRAAGFEEVVVVFGPEASVPADLQGAQVVRSPDDPFKTFREADLVLTAAGSTVWELAFLGRPMALVAVVPNQQRMIEAVSAAGFGFALGEGQSFRASPPIDLLAAVRTSKDTRTRMSNRGRSFVDGGGALRVARHLWSRAQLNQL